MDSASCNDLIDDKEYSLEELLDTDKLFVDYFNAYLHLPSFAQPLFYNNETGSFEICSSAQKQKTLNKEQSLEWIKSERLPRFLESDCYHEFCLAKQLSQVTVTSSASSSSHLSQVDNSAPFSSFSTINGLIRIVCHRPDVAAGDVHKTLAESDIDKLTNEPDDTKQGHDDAQCHMQSDVCVKHLNCNGQPLCAQDFRVTQSTQSSILSAPTNIRERVEEDLGPFTDDVTTITGTIPSYGATTRLNCATVQSLNRVPNQYANAKHVADKTKCNTDITNDDDVRFNGTEQATQTNEAAQLLVQIDAPESFASRQNSPRLFEICDRHGDNFSAVRTDSGINTSSTSSSKGRQANTFDKKDSSAMSCHSKLWTSVADSSTISNSTDVTGVASKDVNELSRITGVNEFKTFLRGTTGQKIWNLWMDIARVRVLPKNEQKIHAINMRERYVNAGSIFTLTPDVLKDLGLLSADSWNAAHLIDIHARTITSLLRYWVPRFLLSKRSRSNQRKQMDSSATYQHFLSLQTQPESYPEQAPVPALPHRPKSCQARLTKVEAPSKKTTRSNEDPLPPAEKQVTLTRARCRVRPTTAAATSGGRTRERISISASTPFHHLKSQSAPCSAKLYRKTSSSDSTSSVLGVEERENGNELKVGRPMSELGRRGREIDKLLLALSSDDRAGRVFRKYIDQSCNSLWMNNLKFWQSCQEFHAVFYRRVLDTKLLQKIAKPVADKIYRSMEPAFEELFDAVEEQVLITLLSVWSTAILSDLSTFSVIEKERDADSRRSSLSEFQHLTRLQRRAGAARNLTSSFVHDFAYGDQLSPSATGEDANNMADEASGTPKLMANYSLRQVLGNHEELEHFRAFLKAQGATIDLHCWEDIEKWKEDEGKRDELGREIRELYLNEKYFFGSNSPATREGQQKVLAAGGSLGRITDIRPTELCLIEVQRCVEDRLQYKWRRLFVESESFQRRHVDELERPASSHSSTADDVLLQQRISAMNRSHKRERRYVVSQDKVLALRQALSTPMVAAQFRYYVSLKGDFLENNVLFYLEVQKCKDISHMHSDKSLISQKNAAVIRRFIESSIPPALQISIGQEMAEKIISSRSDPTEATYIFRDAQAKVFQELLPYWDDFCAYREHKSLSDAEFLESLKARKQKMKDAFLKKMKMIEDMTQKEKERKKLLLSAEYSETSAWGMFVGNKSVDGESEREFAYLKLLPYSWTYSVYLEALKKNEPPFHGNTPNVLLPQRPLLTSATVAAAARRAAEAAVAAGGSDHDAKGGYLTTALGSKRVSRTFSEFTASNSDLFSEYDLDQPLTTMRSRRSTMERQRRAPMRLDIKT